MDDIRVTWLLLVFLTTFVRATCGDVLDTTLKLLRIQCSTTAEIDHDPDRQYRLGHFWLNSECEPSLPVGPCMMGIRRMTPYFDGTWLQDDTQIWNRSIQFGKVFFPGGPGFGTGMPPWWNPSGIPFLDDNDHGRQRTDFDTVVEILCTEVTQNQNLQQMDDNTDTCNNININSDGKLIRTSCFSTGTITDVRYDPFIPFTFSEGECDNGLPIGDCIAFNKLFNICGNDCDRVILGPNDETRFNKGSGVLLTNFSI